MPTTTTFYGLRIKATGALVEVDHVDQTDGDCCTSIGGELTDSGSATYLVADMSDAVQTLLSDTPWYNSSPERPRWGRFHPDELEIVKVVRTEEISPVAVEMPFMMPTEGYYHCFDLKPSEVSDAGVSIEKGERYIGVIYKSGAARTEVAAQVGNSVAFAGGTRRKVLAVVEVPARFRSQTPSFDGYMVVCSTII